MNFLGATSCPDLSKTQLALTNYFSASSSESYSCVKGENPACSITEVLYFYLAPVQAFFAFLLTRAVFLITSAGFFCLQEQAYSSTEQAC